MRYSQNCLVFIVFHKQNSCFCRTINTHVLLERCSHCLLDCIPATFFFCQHFKRKIAFSFSECWHQWFHLCHTSLLDLYSSQIQHSFVEKEHMFLFVFLSRNTEKSGEIYKGFG